jgi:signal transduction histidine kinase
LDKFKLLVVDDNKKNLFTFVESVQEYLPDIDVTQALSGNQALEILLDTKIDLIFLDIKMPDIDGFELAKYIKSNNKTKDIPIIFFSAVYKSDEFIDKGYKIGAVDYLVKPIDVNILINKIKTYQTIILQKKELENNLEIKEERIQKQQTILENNEKLAMIGEMIGMIAHQWRQPLTAVGYLLEEIQLKKEMDLLDSDTIDNNINSSIDLLSHMSDTINEFRTFVNPNLSDVTEHQKVKDTIQKALLIVGSRIKSDNVEISKECRCNEDTNICHKKLEEVVINIIINSLDAFEERGTKDKKISILGQKIDDKVVVEISDNAGGIDEDMIDKVFEPYFSTKSKNGTGLGLYMSKVIMNKHIHGDIKVENIEDGVKFTLTIPLM